MKSKNEIKTSDGLIWIVYGESGDPIQVWDTDESVVQEHCLKQGWSYQGFPVFRKEPTTRNKRLSEKTKTLNASR